MIADLLEKALKSETRAGYVIHGLSLASLIASFFGLFEGAPFDPAWVAVVLEGIPIVREAAIGLLERYDVTADVLVASALLASLIIGEIFAAGEVAFIMALGTMLEDRTIRKAREGLEKLTKASPTTARIVSGGADAIVSPMEVKVGDVVRVLPGEIVPVDGTIVFGKTSIDQSLMTGESIPVDKAEGDEVFSGTVNQMGAIDFKAVKVGEDTSVSRMIRLVESAEASKTPIVRIMDRVAVYVVALALLTAIAVFIATGESVRAVTILVVFCPCALVLSTPTAIMAGIGNASRRGVIISSGEALERLAKVTAAAFDKTGTITYGRPEVAAVIAAPGISEAELWKLAAAVEERSEHPLGKAIKRKVKQLGIKTPELLSFTLIPGRGVEVETKEGTLSGGSLELMREKGASLPKELKEALDRELSMGRAIILIAKGARAAGLISLEDAVRSDARRVMADIEETGVKTFLLTGDHKEAAAAAASMAAVSDFKAELRPEDKVRIITQELPAEGFSYTLMVGDGLNDAPALKAAYVSLAMGGEGAGLAVEAADGVLVRDDLKMVP
ncbi:MAG: cation-translocating P-type ATPase, partial [Deltaproteobacteria bacterium]|nr:cation-translocating P-type ATPase [Deltaproteobacteria bacterium]